MLKGMNESDPKYCPDCNSSIKRVFVVGGIQFKGKGFYSTER